MAGRFDVALKGLVREHPVAFLTWCGLPVNGPVSPVSTDLAALAPLPDTAVRVDGPEPYVAHFEFQGDHDPTLPERLFTYNALFHIQLGLPIVTIVLLLRPSARARRLTGMYVVRGPDGTPLHRFRYIVVDLWRMPAETLLAGDLWLVPLAPVADLGPRTLIDVLRVAVERIETEGAGLERETLWATLLTVLDLQYDPIVAQRSIEEVVAMLSTRELPSVLVNYYEKGREEGRLDGERLVLLNLGRRRFGEPDPASLARLMAIDDRGELARIMDRFFDASTWPELLAD